MKFDEKGKSMLEIIMVIGIMAILTMGVIKLVNKVLDKYRISVVGTQIQALRKNISSRYLASGSYKEVTMDNVDKMFAEGLIPKGMYEGGKIYHAFGGTVQLAGTNNGKFRISFEGLSRSACVELALLNWKVDDTSFLDSITIGATIYTWEPTSLSSNILPVTVEQANSVCNNGSAITWTFL